MFESISHSTPLRTKVYKMECCFSDFTDLFVIGKDCNSARSVQTAHEYFLQVQFESSNLFQELHFHYCQVAFFHLSTPVNWFISKRKTAKPKKNFTLFTLTSDWLPYKDDSKVFLSPFEVGRERKRERKRRERDCVCVRERKRSPKQLL